MEVAVPLVVGGFGRVFCRDGVRGGNLVCRRCRRRSWRVRRRDGGREAAA